MGDGKILQGIGFDHVSLCGKYYGALNAEKVTRPNCVICTKIANGIGNKGK